jgi:hypothetical protein
MTYKLYIDGTDAFLNYGISVIDGGYNELIEYPPIKTVDYNDWQEEDGIQADLSAPVLDSREFEIKFSVIGKHQRLQKLVEKLIDGAYHDFYFKEAERTYKLRMVSHTSIDIAYRLKIITFRFADDFPLFIHDYSYNPPVGGIHESDEYKIDNKRFSDYGIYVLQGTLPEIIKIPGVKQNLFRNISSKNGAYYDGENVTFKEKEVKINCLMRAKTISDFWLNYAAFFYDLTLPNERMLYTMATGKTYPCYYKSCSVSAFYPVDKIWFQFTITLVFTSFRLKFSGAFSNGFSNGFNI